MHADPVKSSRRDVLSFLAASLVPGTIVLGAKNAFAQDSELALPPGSRLLRELSSTLAKAPRRRDFKTVPMILDSRDQWDHEALDAVLAYRGNPKQAFDNTEIDGPWLNLMRNSMNAQVFSFRHPDFLCVSATHGTAHLALYDDFIWTKYEFAKLTKAKLDTNTFSKVPDAGTHGFDDVQKADGFYSSEANSIPVLQRRGAVFIACHNQVWEITGARIKAGVNPDGLSHEAMAAEFTNHLIAGVVLSPGAIGTLPELLRKGFTYAK